MCPKMSKFLSNSLLGVIMIPTSPTRLLHVSRPGRFPSPRRARACGAAFFFLQSFSSVTAQHEPRGQDWKSEAHGRENKPKQSKPPQSGLANKNGREKETHEEREKTNGEYLLCSALNLDISPPFCSLPTALICLLMA